MAHRDFCQVPHHKFKLQRNRDPILAAGQVAVQTKKLFFRDFVHEMVILFMVKFSFPE